MHSDAQPAPGTSPAISVVIVTYDDREKLAECLQSVFGGAPAPDRIEVMVVDDGSSDDTVPYLRAHFPNVRVLTKPHSGADNSRNQGIEAARGQIVAFIDSDCTAGPQWLNRLERALVEESRAVVGGRVSHRGSFWQRMVGVSDFGEFQDAHAKEVSNIPTCNMGLRRECLADIRFAPELRVGGDVVFCSALRRRGIRLHYDPELEVFHHPRVDARHFFSRAVSYGAGFVATRRRDPSLRFAQLVAYGPLGVAALTLGRVLLDWYRLLRYRREMGISVAQLPPGMAVLLLKRVVSLIGAVRPDLALRP